MMNNQISTDIKINDLAKIDASLLMNDGFLAKLEELSLDTQFENEAAAAREFYEALEKLVRENSDTLKSKSEIYTRYSVILSRLMWQALFSFSSQSRHKILGKNLVFSLRHGVDALAYLKNVMDVYEFGMGADEDERRKYLYNLTNNEERLGREPLRLKTDEHTPPTVKNWLRDFTAFTTATKKTGNFAVIDYLNSSANARKLSTEDRDVLKRVFEIYFYLKTPLPVEVVKDEEFDAELRKQVPPEKGIAPAPPFPPAPTAASGPPRPSPVPPHLKSEAKHPLPEGEGKKVGIVTPPLAPKLPSPAHGANLEELLSKMEKNHPQPKPVPLSPLAPLPSASTRRLGEAGQARERGSDLNAVKMTPAEIKREVETPELPGHGTRITEHVTDKEIASAPPRNDKKIAPVLPKPQKEKITAPPPPPAPTVTSRPIPGTVLRHAPQPIPPKAVRPDTAGKPMPSRPIAALEEIATLDDLKKISIKNLRQGDPATQGARIKEIIVNLIEKQRLIPFQAVVAFEQSPLFKQYLELGSFLMADHGPDRKAAFAQAVEQIKAKGGTEMSLKEFETIADLRKEIESL